MDVPIYENGKPTGRAATVANPPPDRWTNGRHHFELRVFEVCRRFGCGCVWEEVRAYVPEGWSGSPSAAVRFKGERT